MSSRKPASGHLPTPHHLYRHWDSEGQLLYVGISLSALQRLAAHGRAPWFHKIATVTIEHFPTRDASEDAELWAIAKEKPLHNISRPAPRKLLANYDAKTLWQCRAMGCNGTILTYRENVDYWQQATRPPTLREQVPRFCPEHIRAMSEFVCNRLSQACDQVANPEAWGRWSLKHSKWVEDKYYSVERRTIEAIALAERLQFLANQDDVHASQEVNTHRQSVYSYCRDLLYRRRESPNH